jgi:4-hydroxy-tetrahydrodipicolinate synthase
MTGFAYPEVLLEIYRSMAEGARPHAEEVFYRNLPLLLFEFQEGIGVAIRKYALKRRGLIASANVRHPGPQITDATRQEFLALVKTVGLE